MFMPVKSIIKALLTAPILRTQSRNWIEVWCICENKEGFMVEFEANSILYPFLLWSVDLSPQKYSHSTFHAYFLCMGVGLLSGGLIHRAVGTSGRKHQNCGVVLQTLVATAFMKSVFGNISIFWNSKYHHLLIT